MLKKFENNEPIPPFFKITKRFRNYTRLNQATQSRIPKSKIAAAILQGKSDSSPINSTNQNNQTGQNSRNPIPRKHPCPCQSEPNRKYHLFDKYLYINNSARPSGWLSDPDILNRFESVCQNPKFKTVYNSALKKFNKSGQNGLLVLAISAEQIILLSRSLELNPKNLWAYDTASDIYICNNFQKFIDFRPKSTKIYIGNIYTEILGYGTVYIESTIFLEKITDFKLLNCAFVPNFYLNIISASKDRKSGLLYNTRASRLETLDNRPICQVNNKEDISLIK